MKPVETLADYIKLKEMQMYGSKQEDVDVDTVFLVIANDSADMFNRDRSDWLKRIERYDTPNELIIEIAKNSKNPAFKNLVDIISASIEAELAED
jgi:hypothetical protein